MSDWKLQRDSDAPIPTLEEVVRWVEEIADVTGFDPDQDMETQGVDSLDLIEFAQALEDTFPGLTIDESALEEALTDRTMRQLYNRIVAQFDGALG